MEAIREDQDSIDIDQKKNQWPHVMAQRGEHPRTGKPKLLILIDGNEGGHVVGSGANLASIILNRKKAIALADFIYKHFAA